MVPMTLVTVSLGNYSRATACCKVFRNDITNAGFLLHVLTPQTFDGAEMETYFFQNELAGDLPCELQR